MMGNRPLKSTQTKESELLYIYKQVQLDIYMCVCWSVCVVFVTSQAVSAGGGSVAGGVVKRPQMGF